MIYAYVGLPGSGKSYSAVANQIIPALVKGRTVVTNIPLVMSEIRKEISTGEVIELPTQEIVDKPERLKEFAKPGCVLVLDELWNIFPSGVKVNNVPRAYKSLLAEHRHMVDAQGRSMQIVFVTQDLSDVGMFARNKVQATFLHRKMADVGLDKCYHVDMYRGPVTGQMPPTAALVRSAKGTYRETVYRFYKSHTMSESAHAGADEKSIDVRVNVWKRPIFLIAPLAAVVALAVGVPAIIGFFHRDDASAARRAASVATGAPKARVEPARGNGPAVSKAPQPGPRWTIKGEVMSTAMDGGGAVLVTAGTEYQWLPFDRFCQRSIEGSLTCQLDGVEISNRVRQFSAASGGGSISQ